MVAVGVAVASKGVGVAEGEGVPLPLAPALLVMEGVESGEGAERAPEEVVEGVGVSVGEGLDEGLGVSPPTPPPPLAVGCLDPVPLPVGDSVGVGVREMVGDTVGEKEVLPVSLAAAPMEMEAVGVGVTVGDGEEEGVALPVALPVGVLEQGEGVVLGVALALGVAEGDTLPSHVPRMAALSRRRVLAVKFKGVRAQQKPAGLRSASGGNAVVKRCKPPEEAEYRRLLLAPQWVNWRVVLGKPGRGVPSLPQTLPLP
jgi:hypothetical protein